MSQYTLATPMEYKPHQDVGGGLALPATKEFAQEPFTFVHYPQAWIWHDEHGFLPDLSKITHQAGVNGVAAPLQGQGKVTNPKLAYAGAIEKGGRLFKVGDSRLGEWANYLVRYPRRDGGFHHCWLGETFEVLPNGAATTRPNPKAWWEFVVFMRESGNCGMMPQSTYNVLLRRSQDRLERLYLRKADEKKIKILEARIEAMQSAWRDMLNPPTPEAAQGESRGFALGGQPVSAAELGVDPDPPAPEKKTAKRVRNAPKK